MMRLLPCLAAAALFLGGNLSFLSAQDPDFEASPADFDEFAEVLDPYGRWMEVPDVGLCWQPRVSSTWAPYTQGHWAYTDAGWTWVSDEPFGGVVFHYGRWILTNRGWCWVPGQVWGPAWVSWRTSPDYIGWAPLPPEVKWQGSRGIGSWVDVQADIGPSYYRFCSVRNFGNTHIHQVVIPISRNATVLIQTQNVTSIRTRDQWVFCDGPDYHWVNQRCERPVASLQLVLQPSVNAFISLGFSVGRTNAVASNQLYMPAPRRVRTPEVQNFNVPPPRSDARLTRGWSSSASGREMDRKVATHVSQEWERQRSTAPVPSAASSGILPRQAAFPTAPAQSSQPSSQPSAFPAPGSAFKPGTGPSSSTSTPSTSPREAGLPPAPSSAPSPVPGSSSPGRIFSSSPKSDRPGLFSGSKGTEKKSLDSTDTEPPVTPAAASPSKKIAPAASSGFSYPSSPSSREPGTFTKPSSQGGMKPAATDFPSPGARSQSGEPSLASPPRGTGFSSSPNSPGAPGRSSQPFPSNPASTGQTQRPPSSSPFSRSPSAGGADFPSPSGRSSSGFSPGSSPSSGGPSGIRSFPPAPTSSPSMAPSSRSFSPAGGGSASQGFSAPSARPASSMPSMPAAAPRAVPSSTPAAAPSSNSSNSSSSKKPGSTDSKKEEKK